MTHDASVPQAGVAWLVLMFQLPARPTAARVRTWRHLQRLGALSVRNSAYFLPWSEEAREDLEWLRADIAASGGEAMLLRAQTVDSSEEAELVSAFREARRAAFEAVRRDAIAARRTVRKGANGPAPREARELGERLAALESSDYFGGVDAARQAAAAAVAALQPRPGGDTMHRAAAPEAVKKSDFKGRTWITRPRPGIDRFASAWLIKRFIDPRPRFAFAASPEAAARRRNGVTFDMYGGAFGHEGGGCTFEALVARFGLQAPALEWLARLVHALDLKVPSPEIPETAAVGRLVEGLRDMHADDRTLLMHGMEMIEALYRSRVQQEPDSPAERAARPRAARARR